MAQRQPGKLRKHKTAKLLGKRQKTATGANRQENTNVPNQTSICVRMSFLNLLDVLLAARSRTKIEKVTLNAVKLTAIFSKRRKIGAS